MERLLLPHFAVCITGAIAYSLRCPAAVKMNPLCSSGFCLSFMMPILLRPIIGDSLRQPKALRSSLMLF